MSPDVAPTVHLWRRLFLIRFGVIGGVLLVALIIEMLILNHGAGRSWWWPPGLALAAGPVVLLAIVGAVAWRVQRNGRHRHLMETTSPADARRVSRALRRDEPLPPGSTPVAQLLVDLNSDTRAQRRLRWVFPVTAVAFLVNFFLQQDWWRWFYLVGAVGYGAGALLMRRQNPRLLANAARQGIHPSA